MARWPAQGTPIQAKVICGATCPHPPPSESGRNNKIDLMLSSSSSLLSSSWPVTCHRPIVIVISIGAAIDDSTYLHQPTAVSGPIHESCFVLKGNNFFVINDVRTGLLVIISCMMYEQSKQKQWWQNSLIVSWVSRPALLSEHASSSPYSLESPCPSVKKKTSIENISSTQCHGQWSPWLRKP